jgi:hypothetical protein
MPAKIGDYVHLSLDNYRKYGTFRADEGNNYKAWE